MWEARRWLQFGERMLKGHRGELMVWRLPVSVYSIWESAFPADRRQEGAEITRRIWADMRLFDGYLAHEIVEDLDRPGHLFVVSRWESREAADAAMSYRSSPTAQRADALASGQRRRTVGQLIDTASGRAPHATPG